MIRHQGALKADRGMWRTWDLTPESQSGVEETAAENFHHMPLGTFRCYLLIPEWQARGISLGVDDG